MKKKFPKEIFVRRENEGTKDEFLSPHEELKKVDCLNERVAVGIYKLVRVVEVKAEPTVITEIG